MTLYALLDDFGRRINFEGEVLAEDTTDDGRKPQWTHITVYRTEGARYVVWRDFGYRVRHRDLDCKRIGEHEPVRADEGDTFACPACNPHRLPGGWGQADRTKMDVYDTPEQLIAGLATLNQQTGHSHHSQFSQALLADVSERDRAVAAVWMEVTIP